MGRRTALLILLPLLAGVLAAAERLDRLITEKRWDELAPLFADESYQALRPHFEGLRSIEWAAPRQGARTYMAVFPDFAEIGSLTFTEKDGRLSGLGITPWASPLGFIECFRRYAVAGLDLRVGDAAVRLGEGFLYQAWPLADALFYEGEWGLRIEPGDAEERLTLERLFGDRAFIRRGRTGIFILADRRFLRELGPPETVTSLETRASLDEYALFREGFAVSIEPFAGTWYLPFPAGGSRLILPKGGHSRLVFDFDPGRDPDTRLRASDEERLILNYNARAHGGPPALQAVREMRLSIRCDPETDSLSGTADLRFAAALPLRTLNLAAGLRIHAAVDPGSGAIYLVRKGGSYQLAGQPGDRMTFHFAGRVPFATGSPDRPPVALKRPVATAADRFYFLFRDQDFYPNPGSDFFASDVSVSVPARLGCLASGALAEARVRGDRASFRFKSAGTKGISLVCGDFVRKARLDAATPLNIYAAAGFRFESYITRAEMKSALGFLVERFGAPDVPEINVLFRRARQEGGLSHQGFVVMDLVELRPRTSREMRVPRWIRPRGPLVLIDSREDNFLHELAHQWWGGMVSCTDERDAWVTEGFSTLASLLYLEKRMPPEAFARLLGNLRRMVIRYAACGPPVYGRRIAGLEDDEEAFQVSVYLRPALALLMLRDMLGEKEFFARARACLGLFKHRSVPSALWIDGICRGEGWLRAFFDGWIGSRRIPAVSCRVRLDGTTAELRVSQGTPAFVFPLRLRAETGRGRQDLQAIVRDGEQVFRFDDAAGFKALTVDPAGAPVLVTEE